MGEGEKKRGRGLDEKKGGKIKKTAQINNQVVTTRGVGGEEENPSNGR